MKKIVLNLIILLFFVNINLSYSSECDESGTYNSDTMEWSSRGFMGEATVDYKTKSINSPTIELRIDWATFNKTNNLLLEDEILKELLLKRILETMPSSPFGFTINYYYKKPCIARLKSIVLLDQSASLDCCPEGINVPNDLIQQKIVNGSQRRVIYNYKDVPCGEKCCKKVYTHTSEYDDFSNRWVSYLSGPITYTVDNCDPNSSYLDCETNQPIPCNSPNCDGFGF